MPGVIINQTHVKAEPKKLIPTLLAHLYFFFNGVGLPFGLLYMHLLSPVFYLWLLYKKRAPVLLPFLVVMVPFNVIHLLQGVALKSFIMSNILLMATYVFTVSFSWFINHYPSPGKLFTQLLISNFIFTLIAIAFFFTPYRDVFWYLKKFTHSVGSLPRLALLTYEASYYSLMFVPLAGYFLLRIFFRINRTPAYVLLLFVLLPLLLSLSIGVLLCMGFAFFMLYVFHCDKIFYRKSFFINLLILVLSLLAVFVFLYLFFPANPVFIRLNNIMQGTDTSANGRTFDSFTMAYRVALERSIWFGSGPGQIKMLAPQIVGKYYQYWGHLEVVRIPNTMAETLATFGIAGVVLRHVIIFYFFFKTKVLSNYYRTWLFVFIFVYQYTGSYLTNVVEYVAWVLAFSNVFPVFRVRRSQPAQPA